MKPTCFYCGEDLRWVGDNDYQDFDMDRLGVMTHYDCNCGVEYDVWQPIESEDERTDTR